MSSPVLWGPNSTANNLQSQELLSNGNLLAWNGPKNYLSYNNFENGLTTGWSLGTTGTLTNNIPTGTPTFGSGTTSLAISVVSSGQLAGVSSLSYVASAATTAGNMLASDPFSIDKEDQVGKVLNFSISYQAISGTANANWSGTASNSFGVAIYDITNSAWIIPVGVFNFIQGIGSGKCTGYFQTSATGTSYRLIMYNANATAGAISVNLDSFFCGPSSVGQSSPVVAWSGTQSSQAVTASVTNIAFTTTYDSNAAWNGTQYVVPVAGHYVAIGSNLANVTGNMGVYLNGTKYATLTATGLVAGAAGGSSVLLTNLKPGDLISYRMETSGTVTGGNFGIYLVNSQASLSAGGVVASRASVSTGASTATTSPINFDTIDYDLTGSITTGVGTWKYTAPISGVYRVQTGYNFGAVSGYAILNKNGANPIAAMGWNISSTSIGNGGTDIKLNAGDFIDIRPSATVTPAAVGGSITTPISNYVSIFLVQGPASQTAQPTIAMKYLNTAGTSVPNTGDNNIPFATKSYDTTNSYNTSTGIYTVPVSGKYAVKGTVNYSSQTYGVNNQLVVSVYKNGALDTYGEISPVMAIVTLPFGSVVDTTVICNAGDTLELRAQNTRSAGATTLNTGAGFNHLEISRSGN